MWQSAAGPGVQPKPALDIIVARATDLVDVATRDGLLPYVVIRLGRHKKKSQRGSGFNPVWNQAFRMEWPHRAWSLSFTVWHEDIPLGTCRVELVEVLQKECLEKQLPLTTEHGTQQGSLHVRLMPQILGVTGPAQTPEGLTRGQAAIRTQQHPSHQHPLAAPNMPERTPSHTTVENPCLDARPSTDSVLPIRPSMDSLLDARPSMDSSIWDPRPSFDSFLDERLSMDSFWDRPSLDSLYTPNLQPPTPPRTPLTSPLPKYAVTTPPNPSTKAPPGHTYNQNPAFNTNHKPHARAATRTPERPASAQPTPPVPGRTAPLATPTNRRTPAHHQPHHNPSSTPLGSSPSSTLDLRFPLLPHHPGSGTPLFLERHAPKGPTAPHLLGHRHPRTHHPELQPPSPLAATPRRDPRNPPAEPHPSAAPYRSTHIVTRNHPHPHAPTRTPPANPSHFHRPVTPPHPNLLHTGPRAAPPAKLSLPTAHHPRTPRQPVADPAPVLPRHHTGSEGTVRLSYPRHYTGSDSGVNWSFPRNSPRQTGSDSAVKLSYPRASHHTGSDSTGPLSAAQPPLHRSSAGSIPQPPLHRSSAGSIPQPPLNRSSAGSIPQYPLHSPRTRTPAATTVPSLRFRHAPLPALAPTPPRSPSPDSTPHSHLSSCTPSLATTDYSTLASAPRRGLRTAARMYSQFSTDAAYGAANLYTDEDPSYPTRYPTLSIHSQFSTDAAYGAANLHTTDDTPPALPPTKPPAAHRTINSLLSTASSLASPTAPPADNPDAPLPPHRASRSTIQSQQSTASTAHSPMIPRTPQQNVGFSSGGTMLSRHQQCNPPADAAAALANNHFGGTGAQDCNSSFGSSADLQVAQLLAPTPVQDSLTPEASEGTSFLSLRPVPQGRFPWQEQQPRTTTGTGHQAGPTTGQATPRKGCTCGACTCGGERGGSRMWSGSGCLSQMLCLTPRMSMTPRHRCVCCTCECGRD